MRTQLTGEELAQWTTTRPLRGVMVIVQVRAPYVIVSETLLMGAGRGETEINSHHYLK